MPEIKDLLPIGSVVLLEGADTPLMVCGVCQTRQEDDKEYDYLGVVYPQGFMDVETLVLFQHDNIARLLFKGYESAERNEFLEKLAAFYSEKNRQQ